MKIEYDPEVKILMVHLAKGESAESEVHGNVVLDYNKEGQLMRLEVLDFNLEELATKLPVSSVNRG